MRVKTENYKAFKTKNGRSVFDGGGISPDIEISLSKLTPITKSLIANDFIFNYATHYYYNNTISDLKSFKLTDSDFNYFKIYLKSNNFAFQTKTEKALENVKEVAKAEGLINKLSKDYNTLSGSLQNLKSKSINDNEEQLRIVLENEIIKRYFYREGLYEYYLINNLEIKTATEILGNSTKYNSLLN